MIKYLDYISLLIKASLEKKQAPQKSEELEWIIIYKICKSHSVLSTVYKAVKDFNDIPEEILAKWKESYQKSIVRELSFDNEREAILREFNKKQIKHLPLKGVYIKQYYPEIGSRMFCDNDILVDSEKMGEVENIMRGRGYDADVNPFSKNDKYMKAPVYNFEMHRYLFHKTSKFADYYSKIWDKTSVKKEYLHELSKEDFYIYFMVHAYGHYEGQGFGIRTLVDIYLFNLNNQLNQEYVKKEFSKLHMYDFVKDVESLSNKKFSQNTAKLTKKENEMYHVILESGAYGTYQQSVKNKVKKQNKFVFMFKRFIPKYDVVSEKSPIIKKFPFLFVLLYLPICIGRIVRVIRKRKEIKKEIEIILDK